ncbi:MAG: sulfite exporter TauE/SafE family protein [Nanoarchaeota archaeon]|nr:sulfite exporter TauE/SafE family protein [Nanoarchaeota archaeon]
MKQNEVMKMTTITKKFKAKGMHCTSCEALIEENVNKIQGVNNIKIDYTTETGEVSFDSNKTNIKKIFKIIEEKGYECSLFLEKKKEIKEDSGYYTLNLKNAKLFGIIFGIIGILLIAYFAFRLADNIALPEISQNMGYGLLFAVGLLTGFHCVSMCGGFVVSYTTKHAQEGTKAHKSHFMYGLGKTISYTVIGAAFGLLGSIIAFTPMMRGIAGIFAGLFLVIFGLNMLNVFPWLRKIRIRAPPFINKFIGKESQKHNSPLIIGLLNGLMIACGPLQAIYIMAAGTGSMLEGAKLLFVFALGTLPVMLGFGFLTSFISSKATHKILKASGAIVIVLGLIMVNRGLTLTGTGLDTNSLIASVSAKSDEITGNVAAVEGGYQEIRMEVNRYGWEPDKFVLKKGVPVRWIIDGKEITGCNNAIQVPKLGLNFDIKKGEQVIEFMPEEEGTIPWSCWMGMIPGVFIVKDDINLENQDEIQQELSDVSVPKSGSCGGSCGSSTCGAATGGSCGCGG